MLADPLTKAVQRRLQELGVPASVMDIGEFRENFFSRHWVMFVRDGDPVANVHLVPPQPSTKTGRLGITKHRQARLSS